MNYDQARERQTADGKPSGLWDWTTMNDGRIRPAGPCSGGCEHKTAQEAELHFYTFSLASAREFTNDDQQNKCAICGAWTQKGLRNNSFSLIAFGEYLCDEHRNPEDLSRLHPLEPGMVLIHS